MFRQIRRRLHHRLNGRARAALLLFVWTFCVVLTVVHDDGDAPAAAQTASHATSAPDAARAAAQHSPLPRVVASCDANGPCHDPSHHHRPLGHHDVTQCPYCALMLERPAELPVFSFAPPATVRFFVAPVVLRLSESQRCACALARGPPPPPAERAPV